MQSYESQNVKPPLTVAGGDVGEAGFTNVPNKNHQIKKAELKDKPGLSSNPGD